ncbi:MAG: hypothetical protein JJU29_09660 [Verrucomicrobia bacterium]|nr:hypothetical protein [Verrucomicrobiota bacterium]MCH8511542.1 hypothetical protein [Kiritimatiellia bacterium]
MPKHDLNIKTDWNIVVQSNISLIWCQWALDPTYEKKTIGELLVEFREKYKIDPLNIGSLIMAAYPLFVFPQQAEFNAINFSEIDLSSFTVTEGTNTTDPKRFCSRIRNSLAHARFKVEQNNISFYDQTKNGGDNFSASISIQRFGSFINEFMLEVKNQFFLNEKTKS